MHLTLYITEGCPACVRAEKKVKNVLAQNNSITLSIKKIEDENPPRVFIVPALFIDDDLFLYGEVDSDRLAARLKLTQSN